MASKAKYYQPQRYHDDGVNITYGTIPEELYTWQVFSSRESAEEWLKEHDYIPEEFAIIEYSGDDIEAYVIID